MWSLPAGGTIDPSSNHYATYGSLPDPTTVPAETILYLARTLGAGYFRVTNPGQNPWEPIIGDTIAKLSADVSLTASGTTYVQLANANVSNLIPDGSEWEVSAYLTSGATHTGSSSIGFDFNGNIIGIGPTVIVAGVNQVARRAGIIRREGSQLITTITWYTFGASGGRVGTFIDPTNISIGVGCTPGAIGNILTLKSAIIRRIQ
jgi:hypothetical protein